MASGFFVEGAEGDPKQFDRGHHRKRRNAFRPACLMEPAVYRTASSTVCSSNLSARGLVRSSRLAMPAKKNKLPHLFPRRLLPSGVVFQSDRVFGKYRSARDQLLHNGKLRTISDAEPFGRDPPRSRSGIHGTKFGSPAWARCSPAWVHT